MKKIFTLAICILTTTLYLSAQYTITDNDVVVTNGLMESCSYNFSIKDIVIPDSLDGQAVTGIGNDYSNLFDNKAITSVALPSTLKTIGTHAFMDNALTSLTIPNSVTYIGLSAFAYNSLTSLTIPDSVTSIGTWAFGYNSLTSLTIPNSVTYIGTWAFAYNYITSLTIPNSVTSIGEGAFYSNSLTSLTIPNSVTYIGNLAFASNYITSLTIPNSVTSIGEGAFYSNSLTSLTIPNSVTSIGSSAFASNSLTSITLPIAEKESYTFVNWNGSIVGGSTVTDLSIAYTANFIINSYTVSFEDWDATQLDQQTIDHSSAATAPADPSRTNYSFTGWDVDFSNITAATTVTAQYTLNNYTVTFEDWDGTQLNQQTIDHGSAATEPSDPLRTGYTFTGWDADFSNVTSNLTVTAMYMVSHTVIFLDWDDTELERQTVIHDSSATAPTDPARTGYTFTGWDVDFSNVISDLTVTAEYTIVTGINTISELNYSFYPNPVSDVLSIEIPMNSNISTIEIFDITGKTLFKNTHTSEGLITIDLSTSPSGLLLIKAVDAKGNVSMEKLMKK